MTLHRVKVKHKGKMASPQASSRAKKQRADFSPAFGSYRRHRASTVSRGNPVSEEGRGLAVRATRKPREGFARRTEETEVEDFMKAISVPPTAFQLRPSVRNLRQSHGIVVSFT